jgi:hypothetical protein
MKPSRTAPLRAAALAAALALFGAAGLGPRAASPEDSRTVVVDVSPSCEAPVPAPDGAIFFSDSDLGAALRRVRSRRALLVTDGCDIYGRAPSPPPGLRVDVALRPRRDDFALLGVEVPRRVRVGEPLAVMVEVGRTGGPGTDDREAIVRLERDGARVGAPLRVRLRRGGVARLRFADRIGVEGVVRYRARVDASVGAAENDAAEAAVAVGDAPVALVIGEAPDLRGFFALRARPEDVEPLLSSPAVAARLDAILLGETPLPHGAQAAVARAVSAGVGLVALIGAGYEGEPLGALLPLTDAPPEGRAVCLALDLSGSMEPHREALFEAARRLHDLLDPRDRVAYVLFRASVDRVVGWAPASGVPLDLTALEARGNTRLLPALEAAAALLREVPGSRRRLFVVSDGRWKDPSAAELRARVRELEAEGVECAAVLVGGADAASDAFQRTLPAADPAALEDALAALEARSADRRIEGPIAAAALPAPAWLAPFAPPPGTYRDVVRFYARGRGEVVALAAGDVPLLAAWPAAERVVQLVSRDPALLERVPSLLRAVARPEPSGGVALRARRDGDALLLEATAPSRADFMVGNAPVPARPVGPGRFRARLEPAPQEAVWVRYLGAEAHVPPVASREHRGLFACAEIAAAIARESGGALLEREAASPPPREGSPALTLLAAVAAVVACGALRRGP